MSCRRYRSQLYGIVYGDGDADPPDDLVTHLARCRKCAMRVRAYRAARANLAAIGPDDPPADMAQRAIMAAFAAPVGKPAPELLARTIAMARPMAAVAVALAVVLFFVLAGRSSVQAPIAVDSIIVDPVEIMPTLSLYAGMTAPGSGI